MFATFGSLFLNILFAAIHRYEWVERFALSPGNGIVLTGPFRGLDFTFCLGRLGFTLRLGRLDPKLLLELLEDLLLLLLEFLFHWYRLVEMG